MLALHKRNLATELSRNEITLLKKMRDRHVTMSDTERKEAAAIISELAIQRIVGKDEIAQIHADNAKNEALIKQHLAHFGNA